MDIKTKHKVGDEFWVMFDNRPEKTVVRSISININKERISTSYYGETSGKGNQDFHPYTTEDDFYSTKEALIASL